MKKVVRILYELLSRITFLWHNDLLFVNSSDVKMMRYKTNPPKTVSNLKCKQSFRCAKSIITASTVKQTLSNTGLCVLKKVSNYIPQNRIRWKCTKRREQQQVVFFLKIFFVKEHTGAIEQTNRHSAQIHFTQRRRRAHQYWQSSFYTAKARNNNNFQYTRENERTIR